MNSSINSSSCYNKVLIINDTKQRKQKLLKKLQQSSFGGISTIENYYECCYHKIQGRATISFHKDSTKNTCMHDMNLCDIRDLLINCLTGKKLNISKSFQLSNTPFIRKIIHLHIDNCPSNEIAKLLLARIINTTSCRTVNDDENSYTDIQCIKVDKEIDFDGMLPYKLLTVPYTKASEIISMEFCSNGVVAASAATSSENPGSAVIPRLNKKINEQDAIKFAVECRNMLLPYIMSPSQLHLWGYMQDYVSEAQDNSVTLEDHNHRQLQSIDDITTISNSSNHNDKSDVKRRKIIPADSSAISIRETNLGITYGELPSREEAEHILARCTTKTMKGNISSTLPGNSHAYNQLWSERSHQQYSDSVPHQPLLVAAIDCELCDTINGLELTRITIIDANASIVLDSFVKPILPVLNYRTQYSGITEDLLSNVTVTLQQIQVAILRLISRETILIGHSLDNDLKAIKIAYHPLCIDTGIIYPHPRGFPLRLKLKKLTFDFLQYSIQDSKAGHDSIEDARAALQLALLKAQNGHMFGIQNPDKQRVSLFEIIDSKASKSLIVNQKRNTHEKNNNKSSIDCNIATTSTITTNDNTNLDSNTSALVSNVSDSILLQQCIGGNSLFSCANDITHAVTLICNYLSQVAAASTTDSNNSSNSNFNNSCNRDSSSYMHEVQLSKDTSQGPISSWILSPSNLITTNDGNIDNKSQNSVNSNINTNHTTTTTAIKVAKVVYSLANLQYLSPPTPLPLMKSLHPNNHHSSSVSDNNNTGITTTIDSNLDEMVTLLNEQISRISSTLTCCGDSNTLLLLTTQCSLEPVVQMLQRRRISSKNNMSAMIWTAENEIKLKELRKHNLAYLTAKII